MSAMSLSMGVRGTIVGNAGPLPKRGLAVAFGSGGARALGSLGVMSVLAKHGIRPVAVSGASMGAIIAAYYGVHGETETLRAWYESKKTMDYLSYMTRPHASVGWIDTKKLQGLLNGFVERKRFDETIVPVRIVGTNLRTGKETVFNRGQLIDAIMGSIAIPGVIKPHRLGDEYYVDGGVTNPTPIDILPRVGVAHKLAIDFHFQVPKRIESPSMFDVVMRSFLISTHSAYRLHTRESKACTIIRPNPLPGYEDLRFDKSREHILRGEAAGKRLIRQWKRNGTYALLTA